METENPFDAYVVSNINEKLRELLSQSSEVQRNTGAQLNTIVLESSDIPASLTRVKSKLNEITGRVAADNEAKEVLSNIIKQEKNQINAYLMNHSQEVNDEASTFLTCKVSILDTIERRLNSI